MYVCNSDTLVICPYDKNHRIFRSRLQTHIVKCEKNFPENYKALCPYDATHRLDKNELMDHILTCPQKRLIDTDSSQKRKNRALTKSELQFQLLNITDSDENWDDKEEFNSPSFAANLISEIKPKVYHLNQEDLRPPRGYSEAMLTETDEDEDEVQIEDMESVISSMGIGRGIANRSNNHLSTAFGRGRGRPIS